MDRTIRQKTKQNTAQFNMARNNFKHLSVYQLRHLFATRCIDVNIPVNQIKQYLGHALASTTMDYYVEYDEDTNKAEIEKLEQVNNIQVVPEFLKGMEQIMSIPKKYGLRDIKGTLTNLYKKSKY